MSEQTHIVKTDKRKYCQREEQIDAANLIRLRFQNKLSYEQIAKIVGTSRQNVHHRIQEVVGNLPNSEEIEAHDKSYVPIMKGVRAVLTKDLIDKDKRKKATLGNVGYVLRNVNDIIRLEEGKSTSNIAYADMSRDLKEMDRDIIELEANLGVDNSSDNANNSSGWVPILGDWFT